MKGDGSLEPGISSLDFHLDLYDYLFLINYQLIKAKPSIKTLDSRFQNLNLCMCTYKIHSIVLKVFAFVATSPQFPFLKYPILSNPKDRSFFQIF